MQRSETVQTDFGETEITVFTCDGCGKETIDTAGWLWLIELFQRYEYLLTFRRKPGGPVPVIEAWNKAACSTTCFRPLMADALNEFCSLWEERNKA